MKKNFLYLGDLINQIKPDSMSFQARNGIYEMKSEHSNLTFYLSKKNIKNFIYFSCYLF